MGITKNLKFKGILSVIFAFIIILSSIPSNVFAELDATTNKSTSWKVDESKLADLQYWPLASKNKVQVVSNGEPVKTPMINYIGTYVNTDGRQVIRLSYRHFQNIATGVWHKALFKFDKELYDLIDWDSQKTGMFTEKVNGKWHDSDWYKEIKPFTSPVIGDTGSVNIKEQNLQANKNLAAATTRLEAPIDLVLKEKKTVDDLQGNPQVQMRLVDDNYGRVFSVAGTKEEVGNGDGEGAYPYNSYTFATFIPSKNINPEVGTVSDSYNDNQFYAANMYTRYNEDQGYLDVIYKQSKTASNFKIGGEFFVFRQVFSKDFTNILKEQDNSGTIAKVFVGKQDGSPWHPDKMVSVTREQLSNSTNSNLGENLSGLQIASNEGNSPFKSGEFAGMRNIITNEKVGDIYLNKGTTEFNSGLPTVVRYFIDKEKMEEAGLTRNDLSSFKFYSTFVSDGTKPIAEYKGKNDTGKAIDIPKGSKITIFLTGNDGVKTPNLNENMHSLVIGDEPHRIELRSNFNHTGSLLKGNMGKEFEYTMNTDMKIPAGTNITYRSAKYNESLFKATLTFPNGEKIELNAGEKVEVNLPRRFDYISTFAGGSTSRSPLQPDIDEIFTTSEYFSGRTNYEKSQVHVYYPTFTDEKRDKYTTVADVIESDVIVDGEKYKGYNFTTQNKPEFTMPSLTKDMPLLFTNTDVMKASAETKPAVIEQVQAKVHFDLNGQTSKIDGGTVIDKVAPLNKNYTVYPDDVYEVDKATGQKTLKQKAGSSNESYKATGFAKIDEKGVIVGADDLKVSETQTVKLTQKLTDSQGKTTDLERTVINYIDHEGKEYDIKASEKIETSLSADELKKVEEKAIKDLLARQFPISEEINLPNAKKIIGWTTVKLEDQRDTSGRITKTAEEQYYELLNSKDSKLIRDVADWDKSETYIFDEKSPLKDERTVYAVYGGLSIVLHSGVNDAQGNEIITRIPVTQEDLDYTDQTLDATSSATLKNLKGKIVMKKMPKAPYTSDMNYVSEADERLKEFKKENNSFIGWTILSDQRELKVGDNNPRISALLKGEITLEDGSKTAIPKESESLKNLIVDKLSGTSKKATLPNGFTFAFAPDNFDKDAKYNNKPAEGLSTRQELLDTVSEIHLYAVYRPYFEVTVNPQYKLVDKTDYDEASKKYGEYTDGVEQEKQKALKIGLLTRTAVTGYGKPTVDAAANYNPIGDANSVLKNWNPTEKTELKWTVPGFDELGRRKSYVSVVIPEGKENEYTNFANPFSDQSWSSLGISTYVKSAGTSLDSNAPRNLYRDNDNNRDPYGVALAKTQAFTAGTDPDIDAFTSATARKPLLSTDKEEVTGYDIVMTNVLESLPTPKFDKVKDTDKEVKLDWKKGTVEAPTDYDKIDKIEFYLDNQTYTLKKDPDGKFTNGSITAQINTSGDKLIVTGLELKEKGGKDLKAKYFETVTGSETSGEIGSTRIISDKTSEPVKKMEQGVKANPTDKPTIKFTVPEKILDQVGVETKYVAEKWDKDQNRWVKVGEKQLTEEDKKNGQYQGNEYDIELTNVSDGDKVRIISYERNKDAEYSQEEKQADPSLQDGFSKPAYSTGDKDNQPGTDGEGSQYVTLDLSAPKATAKATEDQAFRRFIDITGELDELPLGQEVTIEFGEIQGAQGNKTITFETKEKAISYINRIPRDENMPKMWIIAKDSKGNESASEVQYNKTYQCKVEVSRPRAGRPFIAVKADMDNVQITIEVFSNGKKIAEGTVTAKTKNKIARLDFKKFLEGSITDETYKLQVNDVLEIKGSVTESGNLYTTNPLSIEVED